MTVERLVYTACPQYAPGVSTMCESRRLHALLQAADRQSQERSLATRQRILAAAETLALQLRTLDPRNDDALWQAMNRFEDAVVQVLHNPDPDER